MEEKIIKKLFEKQTKEIREESHRHTKMVLEEFESRLRPIAEILSDHTKTLASQGNKLDAIMEMVAKNTEDIDIMKGMLRMKVDAREHEALERRVSVLEKKLRMG